VNPSSNVQRTRERTILAVLASLALMTMFVEIMLVPALPNMVRDFPQQAGWIPWVLSIYMLVGAVVTPLVGRLGDMHGKKRVLIAVMVLYVIALLGGGFSIAISEALFGAPSIFVLLFFRALQGVGMGMFTLAFGIVRDTFPPAKVPMAIGIISSMFAVGVSIGLIGGGWITSVGRWNDAFYVVTVPFIALTIASAYLIKEPAVSAKGSLDVPGAFLLGSGVFLFLLSLVQGEEQGWSSSGFIIPIVLSVVLLAAFVVVERKVKEPIMRPSLFRSKGIIGANVAALFVGITMFMVFQTLPFFLMTPQFAGGLFGLEDTLQVGIYMLPNAIATLIFSGIGGMQARRTGAFKVLITGMGIMAVGFVSLIFLHSSFIELALSQTILGAGTALCMVSLINVVVESCPKSEFGVASGMNTLFRIIGGSVGPVLATAILATNTVAFGSMVLYTEQGYVDAWTAGLLFALIGLAASIVLRPREVCSVDDLVAEDQGAA
jgi:MFS family permease